MDLEIQSPSKRPGAILACVAALLMGVVVIALTGCTPADSQSHPIDAVEVAHAEARLAASERPAPEPDPWPDMPEEIRSEIVSDAMAGVDPRLVDVEQRLTAVERRIDTGAEHVAVIAEGLTADVAKLTADVEGLDQRVSAIENLPKAPTPNPAFDELVGRLKQLEIDRKNLDALEASVDRLSKGIDALAADPVGCKCGPNCTCGPDCECPDGCNPDCPCQRVAKAMGADPATRAASEKPYASVTLLSLPGCPPCEQWKREVLPTLLEKGWAFAEVQLTIGRGPQFRVCIGDGCYVHQGFMTGSDLARIVRQHNGEPEPVQMQSFQPQAAAMPFRSVQPVSNWQPLPFGAPRLFGRQGAPLFSLRGGCCGG